MDIVDAAHLGWGEVVARLVVALLFGAIVGFDREVEGRDAGVRTHMLLSLGAATFGLISVGGFAELTGATADTNVRVDVTRVASYVAAGIGFLGGGTILKRGDRIQGLTTAASLWAVAGIGLASGLGFFSAAVVATVLATVTLVAERPLSWLADRLRGQRSRSGDPGG